MGLFRTAAPVVARPRRLFRAVGLGFPDGEKSAPCVTLKGEFEVAEKIVLIARRNGIPVIEREEVCDALAGVHVDQRIPKELYEVAAAILREVGALLTARRVGVGESARDR